MCIAKSEQIDEKLIIQSLVVVEATQCFHKVKATALRCLNKGDAHITSQFSLTNLI